MKSPRGLTADEAALWALVARTVTPLHPQMPKRVDDAPTDKNPLKGAVKARSRPVPPPPVRAVEEGRTLPLSLDRGLDSSWERKLSRAAVAPDFTLDLHGCTLDQAHQRLDSGLWQAKAMGARLVLLITGRPRPSEFADRGSQRGAIRAKVLDWLAAGPHRGDIAAIRKAHRQHGGEGALYLVIKRKR